MARTFPSHKSTTLLLITLIGGCVGFANKADFEALYGPSYPKQRELSRDQAESRRQQKFVSYQKDVKPILDSRCVSCHSCYDAPCQLKLTSFQGMDRGASKSLVYDAKRLNSAEPTRLFIDAADTAEWRKKSFHPVLNERNETVTAALDNSLLAKFLQLKRDHPLPPNGRLPDSFNLALNREQSCPTIEEFADFRSEHPLWGMPYAMPGLTLDQEFTLLKWLQEGAKIDPRPDPSEKAAAEIAEWETFFNGRSLKQRLVSRYIYEHLFIGHLHLQGHPDDQFYRLVRSSTPPGIPVREIPSVRPYDNPQTRSFYYRLRPVEATIVDKTHFVYELSAERLRRYGEIFLYPDYSVDKLPSYRTELASNPFKTFIDIPVTSRYKFLLDDAEFFVSGFIKGPVCRGQVALNVIRDRFWVVFLTPGMEYADEGAQFLADNTPVLALPGEAGDDIGLFDWRTYDDFGKKYLKQKENFIGKSILKNRKLGLDFIWDGEKHNRNAALTIFRHQDSATVVSGFVGDTPLTGWIVDYPLLERIHYLLVAGFNVYGSGGHQLATRKYMDYLRIDAENNFLRFMPSNRRQALYDNWHKGLGAKIVSFTRPPLFSIGHETDVPYQTTDPKKEFFQLIRRNMGPAAGETDPIAGCPDASCEAVGIGPVRREANRLLRRLSTFKGKRLKALPEVSFLRVETGDPDNDLAYTLLLNKAYSNIVFMIADEYRREPENDTVTVIPGFVGSYPNFFFSIKINQLNDFIEHLKQADTDAGMEFFYGRYGIRRNNPAIWEHYDWFNRQYKISRGRFAGIFDMNRYQNL